MINSNKLVVFFDKLPKLSPENKNRLDVWQKEFGLVFGDAFRTLFVVLLWTATYNNPKFSDVPDVDKLVTMLMAIIIMSTFARFVGFIVKDKEQ